MGMPYTLSCGIHQIQVATTLQVMWSAAQQKVAERPHQGGVQTHHLQQAGLPFGNNFLCQAILASLSRLAAMLMPRRLMYQHLRQANKSSSTHNPLVHAADLRKLLHGGIGFSFLLIQGPPQLWEVTQMLRHYQQNSV
mmetsp:Transcript_84633/g.147379  ORF Transcript_84633/g.147379 Transcript_84633/m.147379 type:complete len:138 (+) Transcript_84633:279-692(+)